MHLMASLGKRAQNWISLFVKSGVLSSVPLGQEKKTLTGWIMLHEERYYKEKHMKKTSACVIHGLIIWWEDT